MPWIQPARANPNAARKIRCDLCSWVTAKAYWGRNHAKMEPAVWWPSEEEHQGEGEHAWCPRCASGTSERARQSYQSKGISVESVMSEHWVPPTALAVPGNTAANTHRDCVPPMAAPPPGTSASSRTDPGRVSPTKPPPPGMSLLTTEERLAALETEVFQLRHSVAKLLEGHSSDAATG